MRLSRFLLLIASSALMGLSAHAEDRPASWAEWESSKKPGDKEMVARIEKADWWKNCAAWGVASRQKTKTRRFWALQDYLRHTNTINAKDLGYVNERLPTIGMTTCGAVAVLGLPSSANNSQSKYGYRTQFVFRQRGVYVYTESTDGDGNALITSLQH